MNKMAEVQNTVRHNVDDLQSFLRDLNQWKDEMSKADQQLLSQNEKEVDSKLPPVRSHRTIENKDGKKVKKKKDQKSDEPKGESSKGKRIPSYDYGAWAKFDVDKACEELDKEDEAKSPEVTEESSEDEDFEELRRKDQGLEEKEKGNEFFRMGKYDQAVECYTRGMLCDPGNVFLPANRALVLIKQERYAAAEQDCNLALSLDKTYVKALQRRGTARLALKKYEEAKNDFLEVLKLEPHNVQAKLDLHKTNSLLKGDTEAEITSKPAIAEATAQSRPPTRVKIVEVGKTIEANERSCEKTTDPAVVVPIDKPPHLRSKKPLKRIKISEAEDCKQKKELQDKVELPMSDSTSNTSEVAYKTFPVPTTSFQFQAGWRQLRRSKEHFYNYIKAIPCEWFPKLFQHSMEVDVLSDILNIFCDCYLRDDADISKALIALANVKRFQTLVMLLSQDDKNVLKKLLDSMKQNKSSEEMAIFEKLIV